jgi:hypothetical protein
MKMRKNYIFLLLSFFCLQLTVTRAQLLPGNYTLAATAGTFTPVTGGTAVAFSGVNNSFANNIPLGFSFTYMGKTSTACNASTSGFITFSNAVLSSGYTNNNLTSGGWGDVIAPLWDNNALTTAATDVNYITTGTAPNRVFTIEWNNVKWGNLAAAGGITFQVSLEETTNRVVFTYNQLAGSLSSASASCGLSIGSSGNGGSSATNVGQRFLCLQNLGATPTTSTSTESSSLATKPANGQTYTFTPNNNSTPAAASGLNFTSVGSSSMVLNWTDNATDENSYLIYQSPDGVTYTLIQGLAANSNTYTVSGLAASTTYYFRVVAVNEGGGPSANLDASQATSGPLTITSAASGNWFSASTWSPAIVPSAIDSVVINGGFTVTANSGFGDATCKGLTIGDGATNGNLIFTDVAQVFLVINGKVTIASGSTLSTNTTGTNQTHQFWIYGDVENNGTVNLSDGGNITTSRKTNIFFKGTANTTWFGTGTTDFAQVNADKGTGAITLTSPTAEITSNFTVADATTDAGIGGGFVTMTSTLGNGILKFSGNTTISSRVFASTAYNIRSSAGFWLNNPNFTITAQGATPVLGGLLRLSAGTWNIGTSSGNSVDVGSTAITLIEGGAMNVAGRYSVAAAANTFNYTQSGGTLTVATIGHASSTLHSFDAGTTTTGSRFNMSGGSIIIQNQAGTANTNDYRGMLTTGTNVITITGGTLQFGNASTLSTQRSFNIRGNTGGVTPSIVVNSTQNPNLTFVTNTVVQGNVTLNGTGTVTYSLGDIIMAGNSSAPGNIANNGMTITPSTGTRTLHFTSSTGNQSYTQTAGTLGIIPNLTINNTFTGGTVSFGVPFTLQSPSSSGTPNLRLTSGLLDASNMTIATTGTQGYTMERSSGAMTGTPTYSLAGTGGKVLRYILNSQTPQNVGGEWPATPNFNSLLVGSSQSLGSTTIVMPADRTVTGTITMGNGALFNDTAYINTNGFTLTHGVDAVATTTLTYNLGQIIGTYKRWVRNNDAATDYRFPMGDGNRNLKNANIRFTSAAFTGGTLTGTLVPGVATTTGLPLTEPLVTPSTITSVAPNLWEVSAADGLAGYTYDATFTSNGEMNVTDFANTTLLKRDNAGSSWALEGSHVATGGNNAAPVLRRNGLTTFSQFGIGGSASTLPSIIADLRAAVTGSSNTVYWTTAQEQNSNRFVVEKSADGRNFARIGDVATKAVNGNSGSALHYNFTDVNAAEGKSYYRLRLVDLNGRSTVTPVITVLRGKGAFEIVDVRPNPASNTVYFNVIGSGNGNINIAVRTLNGAAVMRKTFVAGTPMSLDMSALPAGYYLLQATETGTGNNTVLSISKQ